MTMRWSNGQWVDDGSGQGGYSGGPSHPNQQGDAPQGPGTSLSFTAQDDPRMVSAYDTLQGRMNSDNSKRAIDHAVLGTMDAAALGAKDMGANMARRGISGTGAGATFLNKNVFQPAQRTAAGQATDISLAEQARQDDLAKSLQGPAGNIAGNNLQNRQFGLNTWQAQQNDARERAQMEQQQRDSELSRWLALSQQQMPGGMPQTPAWQPPGQQFRGY